MTVKPRKKLEIDLSWARAWFALGADEKRVLAGVLAIAAIGVAARYVHLRSQSPQPFQVPGGDPVRQGGAR